jgi:hypothetical protein
MKAVGGDGEYAGFGFRVVKNYPDLNLILLEASTPVVKMYGAGPQTVDDGVNQYLVEICSVDREMRMLVTSEPAAWLRKDSLAVAVKIGKFASLDTVAL